MKTKHIIGISVAVVFIAAFPAIQHLLNSPKNTFERLVMKPIPNSVQFIEQGKSVAMDSTLQVLRFQIGKADLQTLLNFQHFSPINESKEFKRWDQNSKEHVQIKKEEFLNLWSQRIRSSTKLDVNLTNTWQIYTIKEGTGGKYIFSDMSGTRVVFVADAH